MHLNKRDFGFNLFNQKEDDCPFRHEPLAIGNPVCDQWLAGGCQRNPCHLRHSKIEVINSLELKSATCSLMEKIEMKIVTAHRLSVRFL